MKGIILLNGEPFSGEIDQTDSFTAACDGAYTWAKKKGLRTDAVIGDFDSLGFTPENSVKFEPEKNFTDGELALKFLLKKGIKDISFYGGGGGRDDHYFGNIELLISASDAGAAAVFYTNYCEMTVKSSSFSLEIPKGKTLSLVPLETDVHIIDSTGLKYPLKDLTLKRGSTRGISNLSIGGPVKIELGYGKLLVFIVLKEYNV